MLQKFYKYFTLSVLSLSMLWFVSMIFIGEDQTKVSAQNKPDDGKTEEMVCSDRSIFEIKKIKMNWFILFMIFNMLKFQSSEIAKIT